MSKQKVSTVDGREVKFFNTRKEAREYNRTEGTIGVYDVFFGNACIKQTKNDVYKRWFVFLDTKPENTAIRERNEQIRSKIRHEFDCLYADTPGIFDLVTIKEFAEMMGVSVADVMSNGAIIPNVAGQPVKFFPTRHAARQYYWMYKGFPAKYLDLHKLHVPYEGNVNNYRWFVYV